MRGIEKRFGAVVALNGASLTVHPGEIMALVGSNGSGKSTLVNILAGRVAANCGEIAIYVEPVAIRSGVDSRKECIATAFQDLSLVPTMSVTDNILLGCEPTTRGGMVDLKEERRIVSELLARFHIECDPDDYVQTLMPSTQSMLEVAKAVFLKPKLLLLDEVTATLHHDEIEILFSIIRELKEEGVAMVYVTHRMNEFFRICDSATIMRGGETVVSGKVSDFTLGRHRLLHDRKAPGKGRAHARSAGALRRARTDRGRAQTRHRAQGYGRFAQGYRGEIVGIAGLEARASRKSSAPSLAQSNRSTARSPIWARKSTSAIPRTALRRASVSSPASATWKLCSPCAPSVRTFLPETRQKINSSLTSARGPSRSFRRTPWTPTTSKSAS
jgi:ABC-type sugar transport system ATPase subunit